VTSSQRFSILLLTRSCVFSDITNSEAVTAWADGCSWSDALEISGLPPGDLARHLARVLDAVRQLGKLEFRAVRKKDWQQTQAFSIGIDPDIRRLCREAAQAINRYPVKDPLAFASMDEIDEGDDNSDDIASQSD
jgi:superfamily II RNA helicase